MVPHRVLRLALLVNDTPMQAIVDVCGNYERMFSQMFETAITRRSQSAEGQAATISIQWTFYDTQEGQVPDLQAPFDALLLTGSKFGANQKLPWIDNLRNFIKVWHTKRPDCRIIGMCFGHHLVAQALGGSAVVQRDPQGFIVGPVEVRPTEAGRRTTLFTLHPVLRAHCIHQDIVQPLPVGFVHLASSDLTDIEMMISQDERVLCLQFHPEFPDAFIEVFLEKRALPERLLSPSRITHLKSILPTLKHDDSWLAVGDALLEFILSGRL